MLKDSTYHNIKVIEIVCSHNFIIQIFWFSTHWAYKFHYSFFFYCESDVARDTILTDTILTVKECEHL